jgi:hypothetical protein
MLENQPDRIACSKCGRLALKETIVANKGKCMLCVKNEEREEFATLSKSNGPNCIFGVATLFLASKNIDYRQNALVIAQVLAEFFTENSLSKNDLISRFKSNPARFYFNVADLSEDGVEFSKTFLQNWFKNIDRWKANADRSIPKYKKSLELQYAKFLNNS